MPHILQNESRDIVLTIKFTLECKFIDFKNLEFDVLELIIETTFKIDFVV